MDVGLFLCAWPAIAAWLQAHRKAEALERHMRRWHHQTLIEVLHTWRHSVFPPRFAAMGLSWTFPSDDDALRHNSYLSHSFYWTFMPPARRSLEMPEATEETLTS